MKSFRRRKLEKILINSNGFVKTVILNRPEKRNALDLEMLEVLYEFFSAEPAASDRVVVIRGEGPSFCSGIDLAEREKKTINRIGEPCRTCISCDGNVSTTYCLCCSGGGNSRWMRNGITLGVCHSD